MGWCSGTDIFDTVVEDVLSLKVSDEDKSKVIHNLIVSLWDQDWDCESESEFFNHPIIRDCFCALGMEDWYREEDQG